MTSWAADFKASPQSVATADRTAAGPPRPPADNVAAFRQVLSRAQFRQDREMLRAVMSIVTAVLGRNLLSFQYRGQTRVVEPHIYGVNLKGHPVLSGYQRRGGSLSGEQYGWKTFLIREMEDVRLLPERFGRPRKGYNPDDPAFSAVYAQL